MQLIDILDRVNSFEKNAFLKIIDNIISNGNVDHKAIDKVFLSSDKDLKNTDIKNIVKIFQIVEDEYEAHLSEQMKSIMSQMDIVVDIMIRDGNSIMKYEWFSKLYEQELKEMRSAIKELATIMANEKGDIDIIRKRDYQIYKTCLDVAYTNDLAHNQDAKISSDEQHLLQTLSEQLELSQKEIKMINYMVIPLEKKNIDELINDLKNMGIIFFSKKQNMIYIPNEIITILRRIKKRPMADKHIRRVLKQFREPQINLICKKHNIHFKGLDTETKIRTIINSGISFNEILSNSIYKDGTTQNEKKVFLNELAEKGLRLPEPLRGTTVDDKINNLMSYYIELEKEEKIGIPLGGYEQLVIDMESVFGKTVNDILKKEFELQDENVMNAEYLLDYNIKPRDFIELLDDAQMKQFCSEKQISSRGNLVANILESYKDMKIIEFENYVNIGFRDLNALKENGLKIKEADLGIKFEDITKSIFGSLGFNVDEKLRKQLNTAKNQIDIVINLGGNEIIIVECKTIKESGYNKFSSVSRQIKSYVELAERAGQKVVKSLLIAPDFSDDFVNECELDYVLNLSLIRAESLKAIADQFEESKLKEFPYNLLMRDVMIKEDRIVKAIKK
ncbi:hypothetical protein ACXWTF_07955 [Thiomicrolovo sp. ZZH C-3]